MARRAAPQPDVVIRAGRRALIVAVIAVLALLAAGCSATTTVAVRVAHDGSGTVTVTVALDAAAESAVGGLGSVLDPAGLAQAGWTLAGPTTRDGVTTVTATHGFASLADLPTVLSGVATHAGRPLFVITVDETSTYWTHHLDLSGHVNLRCGLDCFGDAALGKAFGSVVGVTPATLERQYHETPAQAFHFAVVVALPGTVDRTNAAVRHGRVLSWQATLGGETYLRASITTTDRTHLIEVVGAAAAVLVLLVLLALIVVVRRRPRRTLRRGVPRRGVPAHARRA